MKGKSWLLAIVFMMFSYTSRGQCTADSATVYKTFTAIQLREDLDFLAQKIEHAHANPFSERTKANFGKEVKSIKKRLKDGMTQKDFYLLAAPLLSKLADEHAGMKDYCLTEKEKRQFKLFPLKFKYENGKAILIENRTNNSTLKVGDELVAVNGVALAELIAACSEYGHGNLQDRKKDAINHLDIFVRKFCFQWKDSYDFTFASGYTARLADVSEEEYRMNSIQTTKSKTEETTTTQAMTYELRGENAYLQVRDFHVGKDKSIETWQADIAKIFTQIQQDKPQYLFIDVSENSGGNSMVGDLLIDHFSGKSIKSYGGTWRRSEEYLAFMKKFHFEYEPYAQVPVGKNYKMQSEIREPNDNLLRFSGKTFIIVGKQTFSSAIMFAVTAQDNHIATLIGESPAHGHANHFGEMIGFTTPHTKSEFWFGVKEWIRPSGDLKARDLVPDIKIDLNNMDLTEIIKKAKSDTDKN